MKKGIFTLIVLSLFFTGEMFAQPWGHRYDVEQTDQNITVDINTNIRVSVEWGEGDWTSSDFGYGLTSDGTDWTWVELPWFEDGNGSDKRCRTDVSISNPGKYYYAYRMIKNDITSYSFGSVDWAPNSTTLEAISTITVGEFSIAAGDWSSVSIWNSGEVPDNTKNVGIYHSITLNQDGNVKSLTINDGGVFSGSSAKVNEILTIADGGSIANNGTFTAGSGKVVFAGVGTVSGSIVFNNVDISGGVNFGSGSTLNGTLEILSSGFVNTNAPTYADGSTLKYSTTGDYGSGAEWNAGNQSGQGVPYNVTVETTNPLRITGSSYKHLRNSLTIASGAELQLSTTVGGDLEIEGDFTDNGTFTHNSRLVTFTGTSIQTIGGTATTTFGYLTIAADAVVVVPSDKNMTVDNSFVVALAKESKAAGQFTLKSDASGTASLLTKSSVSGGIKVERFLSAGWDWHFLSSPVVDQPIVGAENFIAFTFGTGGDEGDPDVDFYKYDETNETGNPWINLKADNGTLNQNFGTPSGNPQFEEGFGYLAAYNGSDVTKSFTGLPFTGPLLVSASYTAAGSLGWNLIGNPYPSAIKWDEGNITKTGLASDYYYIYNQSMNAGGGGYEYYKDGFSASSAGANGDIPAMQAFFVEAAVGDGSIIFSNNARKHSTQEFYKSGLQNENILSLRIDGAAYYSESQLYLREGASSGRDENDASMLYSFNSQVPHFYSIDGDEKMVANSVPFSAEDYSISMGLKTGEAGTYTITAEDIQDFNSSILPILEDIETSTEIDLRFEGSYTFQVAEAGINHSRFILHMKTAVGVDELYKKPELAVSVVNRELRIYNLEAGSYQVRVMDIMGRVLVDESYSASGNILLPQTIKSGAYIVEGWNVKMHFTQKVVIR